MHPAAQPLKDIMPKQKTEPQERTEAATADPAQQQLDLQLKPDTSVAALVGAMEADAGQGMEGATVESFAIPFLSVLQSNSPQVDEASGAAIDGARAGMLFESVTGALYSGKPDAGVRVVPCAYRRVFLRWGPRSGDGAGFRGELTPERVAADRAAGLIVEIDGRLYFPGENGEIRRAKDGTIQCDRAVDTRNHYVLILNGEGADCSWMQALVSLSSTQIKKSKNIMAALASVKVRGAAGLYTPPTFASVMRVTTVPESNDKGNWYGIRMEIAGRVDNPDVYKAAKAFRDAVVRGNVEANYSQQEPAHDSASPGEPF